VAKTAKEQTEDRIRPVLTKILSDVSDSEKMLAYDQFCEVCRSVLPSAYYTGMGESRYWDEDKDPRWLAVRLLPELLTPDNVKFMEYWLMVFRYDSLMLLYGVLPLGRVELGNSAVIFLERYYNLSLGKETRRYVINALGRHRTVEAFNALTSIVAIETDGEIRVIASRRAHEIKKHLSSQVDEDDPVNNPA